MKRNLLIIIVVSAFLALMLWILGIHGYFYRFNAGILKFLADFAVSLFK